MNVIHVRFVALYSNARSKQQTLASAPVGMSSPGLFQKDLYYIFSFFFKLYGEQRTMDNFTGFPLNAGKKIEGEERLFKKGKRE